MSPARAGVVRHRADIILGGRPPGTLFELFAWHRRPTFGPPSIDSQTDASRWPIPDRGGRRSGIQSGRTTAPPARDAPPPEPVLSPGHGRSRHPHAGYAPVGGRASVAEQQSAGTSDGGKGQHGHGPELTKICAVLLGLAVLSGAVTDQRIKLSNQVVSELPATGIVGLRLLVGAVGLLLLLWGLDGLLGRPTVHAAGWLRTWWHRRRLSPPPARDVGRPPDRSPLFRDREAELKELRQRLVAEGRLDLSGMGGVGKTQLAIEYLHRHHDTAEHDDYPDGVFWLRGETAAVLNGDFAALAWLPDLLLPEREEREQERVIEAVIGWLRSRHRWLLVIDNLDQDAISALQQLLVRGLRGHVLVTSRAPVWDPDPLGVRPWPPEVAVPFVLERSGRPGEGGAAGIVAELLGGLPLALVQAAGYVKASGAVLASYAELLRTRMGDLLREGRPQDYLLTVAATLQLSFERIEREQPASAALLRLCAFLAPDNIPLGLLADGARGLPEELRETAADAIRLDHAVGELRRYALIDRQGDGLRVHRLVQWVVRESLQAEAWEVWLTAALRLEATAFPERVEDPEQWPLCAGLLPHAQATTGFVAARWDLEPEMVGGGPPVGESGPKGLGDVGAAIPTAGTAGARCSAAGARTCCRPSRPSAGRGSA